MKTEIEAKWLRIDLDEMRGKLEKAGAKLIHSERLMSRKTYDFPDRRLNDIGAWVRVRNEGDKVTMSFKQLNERSIVGMKEASILVDNQSEAEVFLTSLGLTQKSAQDTKRESWTLNGCEIELDTWPWIPSFLEIEGYSQEKIYETAEQLGLLMEDALYGGVEPAYQDVFNVTDKDVDSIDHISFDIDPPEILESNRIQE